MSPTKALEIAENIFEEVVDVKQTKSKVKKLLLLTEEQKNLTKLFNF